jgi:hypothetical protein
MALVFLAAFTAALAATHARQQLTITTTTSWHRPSFSPCSRTRHDAVPLALQRRPQPPVRPIPSQLWCAHAEEDDPSIAPFDAAKHAAELEHA